MKIKLLVLLAALPFLGLAQTPSIEWQKCFGGSASDLANSILQTSDDGFIVAGYTLSNDGDVSNYHGLEDCWLIKLDSQGNIVWQKALGGSSNEQASAIEQTSDDGYIVAGWSLSNDGDASGNHGGVDYWVVKLDANGNLLWQRSLGGSQDEYAQSVSQTFDGGYIISGWTRSNDGDVTGWHDGENEYNQPASDYWIVKLDANGSVNWQKCFGGSRDDFAYAVKQTQDNGIIVTGNAESVDGDVDGYHDYHDLWMVKLDVQGNLVWQKSYGPAGQRSSSLVLTNDGGFAMAAASGALGGDVTESHGQGDYWIVKLDSLGNLLWQKSFGGSYGDIPYSIDQTTDGGYCIAGWTNSNDQDVTGWHQAYDNFGDPLSDVWIVKLNSDGELQWKECLGGSSWEEGHQVGQTMDDGFIVVGYSESNDFDVLGNHGESDVWVVKLSAVTGIEDESSKHFVNIFPNPSSGIFEIQFSFLTETTINVSSAFGTRIISNLHSTRIDQELDLSSQPSGIYFLQLQNDEGTLVRKIIISR